MTKKVLISIGSKHSEVNYLSLITIAEQISKIYEVAILKTAEIDLSEFNFSKVITADDLESYEKALFETIADVYIYAANWDKDLSIKIKEKFPRSTLIFYSLEQDFDEINQQLKNNKANLLFAPHPQWLKSRKNALTLDGAVFEVSFMEQESLIKKIINEEFYQTKTQSKIVYLTKNDKKIISSYPKYPKSEVVYGTFAVRKKIGFITTSRGKKNGVDKAVYVESVNHESKLITASDKATLNAPLLAKVFEINPHLNILIHGHELVGRKVSETYEFPGTKGELTLAVFMQCGEKILLPHHGYLVGFSNIKAYERFISEK